MNHPFYSPLPSLLFHPCSPNVQDPRLHWCMSCADFCLLSWKASYSALSLHSFTTWGEGLSQWFPGPFLVYLLLGLQSDISKLNPTICLPYLKSLAHFVFPGKRKKPTCPLSHDPQAIHDQILCEHSSFCVLFPSDIFHSWHPQPHTIFQLFQAK